MLCHIELNSVVVNSFLELYIRMFKRLLKYISKAIGLSFVNEGGGGA